ncbi:MAG: hypothetical protein CVV01_05250 [Firmicutes bacterium HGW-Firmicutes-6]|jgi:hypothetical protein|nr:MAG: hypothetical protein CVV01_05250 [Firmicutes bacterium HGW-Firmicutes-6]
MDENVKVPWWQKTWVVVLACIFIPPAGIALLWVGQKGGMVMRVVLTVILGFYSLAWFGGIVGGSASSDNEPVAKTEVVAEDKVATETVAEEKKPAAQEVVAPDTATSKNAEIITINNLSENLKATIGEMGTKTYGVTTGGGFSVMSITRRDTLTIGDNNFANCIDFQVYSTVDSVKKFAEKDAFFRVFDSKGNENTDITTRVGANGDNVSVIIESSQPLSDSKFIVIGPFNPEYNNGNRQVIFEVQ